MYIVSVHVVCVVLYVVCGMHNYLCVWPMGVMCGPVCCMYVCICGM